MRRKTDEARDARSQYWSIVYSVVDFFNRLAKWDLVCLCIYLFVGEKNTHFKIIRDVDKIV